MLKIALVNLPFASYHLPSIGLTQLKAVVEQQYGDRVSVRIVYANHDFANYIGLDLYEAIGGSEKFLDPAFPEWFFRNLAFPDIPDNADLYLARYFPGQDAAAQRQREQLLEKRRGAGAALDAVLERYGIDQADVVGFTSMFFENMASFAAARKLKERNPRLITVMGGATSESPAGEEFARAVPAIDFVFSGPGLKSFPRFIGNLLAGTPEENDRIAGVFSKCNVDAGGTGGVAPMGEELNINVPIELDYGPFLDSLDQSFPGYEIKAVLPFETSRGCWWGEHSHCTFCGLNKSTMGYRAMRPDLAVELIRSLFKYADRASVLMCVDNILERHYVKEVFPHLDTPEQVIIFYQLKANLTEAEVAAMSAARVKAITPGFESLSTATLNLMHKGVTAFHNLQVMKYCALYDVFPGWNLLIGSPGEEEATYAKYVDDLPRLVHLPPPQGMFSIRFDRYSPYFDKAKEYGLDLKPIDYYSLVYPFGPEAVAHIAYEFEDQNIGSSYFKALARWVDRVRSRIDAWRERWQPGAALAPRLFLFERGGRSWAYDSRDGQAREIPLTPGQRHLLGLLDKPWMRAKLEQEVAGADEVDFERDLEAIRGHGLLFEEGEKMMSLALHREPPPMTSKPGSLGVKRKLREATSTTPAITPISRAPRRPVRPQEGVVV
jgi:ribosomal peptide maturation radical SAM protein 1